MRSRHNKPGEDKRQGSESPYLAAAIRYLTQNTQRPLWPGQRETTNALPEEPNPLYPPLTNSRASFITSLNCAFKEYFGPNPPKEGRFPKYSSDEGFLNCFLERLNTPSLPSEYAFITVFDPERSILSKFRSGPNPVGSLAKRLGPIGVSTVDQNGRPETAFPIAFLEILQGVIEEHPSLKEDHLIAKAVLEYMKYLDATKTTEACMDVSSLALQRENLETFIETGLFDQLMEQSK
jgi:hypothetical protein